MVSYDLTTVTWTDNEEMSKQLKYDMPDIVLVRKVEIAGYKFVLTFL